MRRRCWADSSRPPDGASPGHPDHYMATLRVVHACLACTLVTTLAGCGDSPSQAPVPVKLGFLVSPGSSTAGAAVTPAIVVAIQDDAGSTVTTATATVTLAIANNPGSSTLSGTTTVAAVNGIASFSDVRLDKAADGYTLTASATGLTPATSGTFRITPAAATKIKFVTQPSDAVAGVAVSPAIRVGFFDGFDNPTSSSVGSVTLSIANNAGNGTLAGSTAVDPISGVATFSNVSINKAGTGYTLSATTSGLSSVVSSAFSIVPAAPAKLGFLTQPSDVEGTRPIAPSVRVAILDAFDNTVTTATDAITLALGSGAENPVGGTLYGTTTVAAVSGVATFDNLRVDRPSNTYALRPTAGTLSSGPSSSFAVRLTFVSVEADTTHTCGVTIRGAAYCWGNQGSGLGDGITQQRAAPILVAGGLTFARVSTGSGHTCGLTTAGAAYCWGAGGNHQIGDGGNSPRSMPAAVSGGLTLTTLASGWYHNCGATSDGTPYCWGYNANAQLGDGTKMDRASPVSPSGGLKFSRVVGGRYHTCAVAVTGAAYCWGSNAHGQIGDNGPADDRTSPGLVVGGLSFGSISAGGSSTSGHSCGLTTNGSAYCWGNNSSGQLGDGSTTNRSQPTAVAGGIVFSAITVGSNHTCALTSGGAAYCWGANVSGQLGDGTIAPHSDPRPVLGPAGVTFSYIAAGDSHTCAVASSGVAYCWGLNGDGQLGVGDVVTRTTPAPVVP
jgi:alpha-tubulin suppressor-like RCC1 family protein